MKQVQHNKENLALLTLISASSHTKVVIGTIQVYTVNCLGEFFGIHSLYSQCVIMFSSAFRFHFNIY